MRRFAAVLLLPVMALSLQADDQKAETPKTTPAAKADAPPSKAKEAYDALLEELNTKMEEAKKPAERQPLMAEYSKKFLAHAKAHPKDDTAIEALSQVLMFNRAGKAKDGPRAEAVALLEKNYLKTPAIGSQVRRLVQMGEDVVGLVQDVAKDNPDKMTRALAYRALLNARNRAVKTAEALQNNAKMRAAYEKGKGKEAVALMIDNADKYAKEIQVYRQRLSKGELKGLLADTSDGSVAPETGAVDLTGKKVKLSDYTGKVVVLDFWATWCGPCREMLPQSRELVKEMANRPFALIGVSVDDSPEKVVNFRKKNDMPWAHWWVGRKGKQLELWDVEGFPTVYVIDHKGVIRFKQTGHDPSDKIADVVEKLVEEAEKDAKLKSE